jgi:hypothetical protein
MALQKVRLHVSNGYLFNCAPSFLNVFRIFSGGISLAFDFATGMPLCGISDKHLIIKGYGLDDFFKGRGGLYYFILLPYGNLYTWS